MKESKRQQTGDTGFILVISEHIEEVLNVVTRKVNCGISRKRIIMYELVLGI